MTYGKHCSKVYESWWESHEIDTTLEFGNVHTKGSVLLNSKLSNIIIYGLFIVGYNENYIITYCTYAQIS
jgi:hypothetical protein